MFAGLTADQVASILNFNVEGTTPAMEGSVALGLPAGLASSQVTKDLLLLSLGTAVESATARMSSGGLLAAGTPVARAAAQTGVSGFLIGGAQSGEVDDIDYDGHYAGAGVAATANDFTFGVAVSRGYADADNGIDVDGVGRNASIFAGYDAGMGVMGRMAVTWTDFDLETSREAGTLTARGDTDAEARSIGAMLGYRMARGDLALLPYVSAVHTRVDVDGYEETGAAQANLVVGEAELDSTLYEVGVRAGRDFGATSVFGDLAYAYTDGDQTDVATQFTTGTAVATSTVAGLGDGSAVKLGLGASHRLANGLVAGMGYEGFFEDGDNRHSLRASLSVSF